MAHDPQASPQTSAAGERLLRDLAEARLMARGIDLMIEAIRASLSGEAKLDLLSLGVNLSDLRFKLEEITVHAERLLGDAKDGAGGRRDEPAGGETPGQHGERLH
jgi:hypothetical protein